MRQLSWIGEQFCYACVENCRKDQKKNPEEHVDNKKLERRLQMDEQKGNVRWALYLYQDPPAADHDLTPPTVFQDDEDYRNVDKGLREL